MEEWFAAYPDPEKAELRKRLRVDINAHHQAAFFELFLHELLMRLGYSVSLHPSVPGGVSKSPDFLVESSQADRFYLEATLATGESAQEIAAQARMNAVYDTLNRLVESPDFFLWMDIRGYPATPPPAKKLAAFIQANLSALSPDEMTALYKAGEMDALPKWHFDHEGWSIDFRPVPKGTNARGKRGVRPIGVQFHGFRWEDQRTPLRNAITDKAGRYGTLDLPFIVAVNVVGNVDQTDIMDALFGQEQITVTFYNDDPEAPATYEPSRVPDGVWTSPSGPRYTRLSGILLISWLAPWNIPRAQVVLYQNPWAQKPYLSKLARLPHVVPEGGHMKFVDGESTSTIMGLDATWP